MSFKQLITVERSLSGQHWCVCLNGNRAAPLYQHERKWRCEMERQYIIKYAHRVRATLEATILESR